MKSFCGRAPTDRPVYERTHEKFNNGLVLGVDSRDISISLQLFEAEAVSGVLQ